MAGLANRKALLSELGVDDEAQRDQDLQQQQAALGDIAGPPLENTGVTGGRGLPAPALDQPIGSGPLVDATGPMASAGPATAPGGSKSYGQAPAGYDQRKWEDPNSKSAKYITARNIDYNALRQIPDEAGRKAFLAKEVQRITPMLEAAGWKVGGVQGDKMLIGGNGFGMNPVDIVGDIEGAATPSWGDDAGGGGGGGGDLAPHAGVGNVGGYALDSALTGDPLAAIQAALAKYSNSPNIQSLLAQLGGA